MYHTKETLVMTNCTLYTTPIHESDRFVGVGARIRRRRDRLTAQGFVTWTDEANKIHAASPQGA